MKIIALWVLVLGMVAVGCQRKSDSLDARVAALEAEIKDLKSELKNMDIPGDIDPATGLPLIDPVTGLPAAPLPGNQSPIVQRVYLIKEELDVEKVERKIQLKRIETIETNLNLHHDWIFLINDEQDKDHERLNNLLIWASQQSYRQPASTQAAPAASAYKDGIPISVYNQIKADAEKEFPRDYPEQIYIIKNQVEAYKKLHP